MDGGSIVEFFYNLIPGGLFLLLFQYYYNIPWFPFFPKSSSATESFTALIFAYIIIGLALGFVFQGLTKICREKCGLNECISRKVKEANEHNFIKLPDKLGKYSQSKGSILTTFYVMDNFLRGKQAAFLPTHNSSLFAFWSNIFFATLLLIILRLIKFHYVTFDYSLFILILGFSAYMAYKYLYAFYDTILKTYFVEYVK